MQIKIGPSFFAKEKRDYADWRFAWVRELAQNSIDAPGCDRIEFMFAAEGDQTRATCVNNGLPMTQATLVEKFLAIGESGKNFAPGSVGGFGKAKILIAFCHEQYQIHTGGWQVTGRGGDFELAAVEPLAGTRTEVLMAGGEVAALAQAVRRFAALAQWDGELILNGERLVTALHKGAPRRRFAWGTVYTNKSSAHRVVVRVQGVPMFTQYTDLERTVIVELDDSQVLTANRDGLTSAARAEFQQFVQDLVTNKSRALRPTNPTYVPFAGAKYAHAEAAPVLQELVRTLADAPVAALAEADVAGPVGLVAAAPGAPSASQQQLQEFFVLKNETTLQVPDYYRPDSAQFGSYSRKLVRAWGRLLLELHRLFARPGEFGIGFVFSEEAVAQHEETGRWGTVYFLNPARVVTQTGSGSRSFKKRFLLTQRDELLAIAAHEFVHGLGYDGHTEDFACKFTEVTGRVLTHARKGGFSWCYRDE